LTGSVPESGSHFFREGADLMQISQLRNETSSPPEKSGQRHLGTTSAVNPLAVCLLVWQDCREKPV
jgi:hypothetical protein